MEILVVGVFVIYKRIWIIGIIIKIVMMDFCRKVGSFLGNFKGKGGKIIVGIIKNKGCCKGI